MNLEEGEIISSSKFGESSESFHKAEIQKLIKSGRATDSRHARTILAARRLAERHKQRAEKDHLTGLYNRNGFFERAPEQLELINRLRTTALLVFLDFDNFKQINDRLGHPVGDQALIEVADVLKESFRKIDLIARLGGDEFGVLAIETEEDKAEAKDKEKRDNLEVIKDRLEEKIEECNRRKDRQYQLSLSMGVTRYDSQEPCLIDELLARADRAMYEQKRAKGILRSE